MSTSPPGAVECLKQDGVRSVWRRREGGRDSVVKAWPLGPGTVVKLVLGLSQPQRQRRGSAATAAAGVSTPAVRAIRLGRRGRVPVVELEHEFARGDDAYELLRRGGLTERRQVHLARACGRIVDAYARAGLLHRDLKLANLIVDDARRGVSVIDTVGVRRSAERAAAVARMLERLWVQAAEQGLALPGAVRMAALRAALRPLSRLERRAALQRLRAYPPR